MLFFNYDRDVFVKVIPVFDKKSSGLHSLRKSIGLKKKNYLSPLQSSPLVVQTPTDRRQFKL